MIESLMYNYVYVATPKTGTRSMYAFLIDYYRGRLHQEHGRKLPSWAGPKTFVFTTVRDPYMRAVSAWWSIKSERHDNRHHHQELLRSRFGGTDLECFMDWLILGMGGSQLWPLLNQTEFLAQAGGVRTLRMEDLPHCVRGLPFVNGTALGKFPHRNRAAEDRPDAEVLLTPKVVA